MPYDINKGEQYKNNSEVEDVYPDISHWFDQSSKRF